MCGTNACNIKFLGSSGRPDGKIPSADIPPKTEPDIFVGVFKPLGETDLDPVGVDVEANREDTEAFELRYRSVDIEEVIDCESIEPLIFGNLNGEGPGAGSGGSKGEA